MSYTYHGTNDLIALPGRSVQTFPSGLVRVERSFVCRKDRVARFRNIIKVNEPMPFDDGSPAIDGLYIFPEPQEVVRDDGFIEFRVTAYGRTNETGSASLSIFNSNLAIFDLSANQDILNPSFTTSFLGDNAILLYTTFAQTDVKRVAFKENFIIDPNASIEMPESFVSGIDTGLVNVRDSTFSKAIPLSLLLEFIKIGGDHFYEGQKIRITEKSCNARLFLNLRNLGYTQSTDFGRFIEYSYSVRPFRAEIRVFDL